MNETGRIIMTSLKVPEFRVALLLALAVILTSSAVLAESSESPRAIQLERVWTLGESDDDVILGAITQVRRREDGRFYLLDAQLCVVHELAPDGEVQRTLFGEGDGPGQVRRPADLVLFPDELVGVVQRVPGKVRIVDSENEPRDTVDPNNGEGNLWVLVEARARGGVLALCGDENSRGKMTQFLSIVGMDGLETHRFLEKPRGINPGRRVYVERDEDFVSRGRWALGPDGSMYLAATRDVYEIAVHSPDGTVERVLRREFTPRMRTKEEKQLLAESIVMMMDGQPVQIESELEDFLPAILRLEVTDDGQLWVLTSQGLYDQPEGIAQTWDVFSPSGEFAESVALACPFDPEADRLIVISETEFIVIEQFQSAVAALRGASSAGEVESDAAPLTVTLWRAAP